ncbi:MAG: type II toxin-antitoxin system Phd/YefM family antitoxin [Pigmentiphaga sp.]
MKVVNMLEAKSSLSRLVDDIATGRKREIILARNGRPAAKLVPVDAVSAGRRAWAA